VEDLNYPSYEDERPSKIESLKVAIGDLTLKLIESMRNSTPDTAGKKMAKKQGPGRYF
jgi:hypothetical protein